MYWSDQTPSEFPRFPFISNKKSSIPFTWNGLELLVFPLSEDHPNWKGGHVEYYGANWKEQRRKALERDDYRCQTEGCEIQEFDHLDIFGESIHVHHITPMREYKEEFDAPTWWEKGNDLVNLITLCKSHHNDWERIAPLSFDSTPHPDS